MGVALVKLLEQTRNQVHKTSIVLICTLSPLHLALRQRDDAYASNDPRSARWDAPMQKLGVSARFPAR